MSNSNKSQSGMSLIELLIVVGISGIMMTAMSMMMASQTKENRALLEKIATADFARVISAQLNDAVKCDTLFNASNIIGGLAALTFDSTLASVTNPVVINLASIADVANGSSVSSLANTVKLESTNGVQVNVTGPTTAQVVINFNSTELVRPLRKLTFPLTLATTGAAITKNITGCGAGSSGGTGLNWSAPVTYSAFTHNFQSITTTTVPYKLCILVYEYVEISGRCAISRNADSTWTIDAAAAGGGLYSGCSVYCYN